MSDPISVNNDTAFLAFSFLPAITDGCIDIKELSKLRLISKLWKIRVDTYLKKIWDQLEKIPDSQPLCSHIKKQMQLITSGSLLNKFKVLMSRLSISTSCLPIRPAFFIKQQQSLQNEALVKIWPTLNASLNIEDVEIEKLENDPAKAEKIRAILNDPENQAKIENYKLELLAPTNNLYINRSVLIAPKTKFKLTYTKYK